MVSSRRLLTTLFGLSAALWASLSLAQTTGTATSTSTGVTDLAASDFTLYLQQQKSDGSWVDLTTNEEATFLNQARCQCKTPIQIRVQPAPTSVAKLSAKTASGTKAQLYVGINCAGLNTATVPAQVMCPNGLLGTFPGIISGLAQGTWNVPTTVDRLFAGSSTGGCTLTGTTTAYLWLDSTGYGYPDSTVSGSSAPSKGITLNGASPPAPVGVTVEGGQEALTVSWSPISSTTVTNLAGYLVFCMRGQDLAVFNPSPYGSQYFTSSNLCSPGVAPVASASTLGNVPGTTTAIPVGAPTAFQNLDPAYLCADRVSSSENSIRITGLQNGIPYQVGVAAVDTSGNASPIQTAFVQWPVPTIDFYTKYRTEGGKSSGGYCAVAGRKARLGAISFLVGGCLLTLAIVRRRRRMRRALRGLPFLVLALAAGSAEAQVSVSHDDSFDTTSAEPESYRTPKEWAFELRFGPFRPNVDSEFSGTTGATPYQSVFGGKRHLMSGMELDWQLFQSFGTLAAGVSFGYYKVNAKAFEAADTNGTCVKDPTTGACVPSGDNTSLRIIPLAALVVYRFDVPATLWSIPLVPYGKLGLNYTLWQVNDGNGNVPYSGGGHGSGGTAGWQAAAGVSLLLDFLDPAAARNLDIETNINHSYLFFEWNHVDASGLGAKNKLHVGDSRWVLGLMFEF